MQAEDLIRGMLEGVGDKNPGLRNNINTLAMLQYQRGREATQRSEHKEMLDRAEKVRAEQRADLDELRTIFEGLREMNAAERRMEQMRALAEGRLRPMPTREDASRTG